MDARRVEQLARNTRHTIRVEDTPVGEDWNGASVNQPDEAVAARVEFIGEQRISDTVEEFKCGPVDELRRLQGWCGTVAEEPPVRYSRQLQKVGRVLVVQIDLAVILGNSVGAQLRQHPVVGVAVVGCTIGGSANPDAVEKASQGRGARGRNFFPIKQIADTEKILRTAGTRPWGVGVRNKAYLGVRQRGQTGTQKRHRSVAKVINEIVLKIRGSESQQTNRRV